MLFHRSPAAAHLLAALGFAAAFATISALAAEPQSHGLLFYVSGEKGTTADSSAGGTPVPNFDTEVARIPDGAIGAALRCGDMQSLAWSAPGNIYAQRGTLSFFWRARTPVGPTQFPIFRVGYGDHSSWDMVWLRIDYNGHGFDAFVTDISLTETRVSVTVEPFPKPDEWIHLALEWDETSGIRFFVNGKLAAKQETVAVYDAALDQFGPHSRIISPHNVQSEYNFIRGGDLDELRIYDHMLADDNVATLAHPGASSLAPDPLPARSLADAATRSEWWTRYGFDQPGNPPPYYTGATLSVRKVEITDAYDLKRWWWKATDGIRETTWPGVYNRSRLPGRNDYFQLPDWDCYVDSGKAITFGLPNEPWNHVEISGAAWGRMELLPSGTNLETASEVRAEALLFERPKGHEKTVHALAQSVPGRQIRFTNVEQEQPIGELSVYNVTGGTEPTADRTALTFRLSSFTPAPAALDPLQQFIAGRFPPDERATMVAEPMSNGFHTGGRSLAASLPLVHILIPDTWDNLEGGLDGIAIDLPALKVKPTHGAVFPLNLQVKDPLWPMRNMLDFTFSVKPGEAKMLWLDLRDRILPERKSFWLTIAGAGADFNAATLEGAQIRLVFKPREAARAEHELDRFTQVRDSYAMLVEEHPHGPKLNLWNRFEADIKDLMRANPHHQPGRDYYDVAITGEMPPFTHATPPAGVPLWAFRQSELLGRVKKFANWYVDHRQVAFGDFGGGISDDVDLLNLWPGIALMGCEPEKLKQSDHALLEAAFKNGMFTNGLPTIQTDYLHSFEEGINCLGQNLVLDFGNPRQLERAMTTARGVAGLTGINAAGHRHIRSLYYSGTKVAEDSVWGWSRGYSYLVLQPGQLLVDYNGNPAVEKILLELADGLLAHRHPNDKGGYELPTGIHFQTDREGVVAKNYFPWPLFWSAWQWTGKRSYLDPIFDGGTKTVLGVNADALDALDLRKDFGPRILASPPDDRESFRAGEYRATSRDHFAWQVTGDKKYLERLYASEIEECAIFDYINTEGSLWIDRVAVPYADLQRERLGGVAIVRNGTFPAHVVSWNFAAPANDQSVALLVPSATRTAFKVIACNLETTPVRATMTGWNIDPGIWEVTQGIDTNDDDTANGALATREEKFERSSSLELTLPPRATTVLTLKLKTPGTPYWARPDLGISRDDVTRAAGALQVTVHSLGSVPAPATSIIFRDRAGQIAARATVPALAAPLDLLPKAAAISLALPAGLDPTGGTVEIDPDRTLTEITTLNNAVTL